MDLAWDLPDGVRAAFSRVADGDQRTESCRSAWLARIGAPGAVAVPKQVHGIRIGEAHPGWHDDVDGLALRGPGSALVFGADCPGLILAGPDLIVITHCGWRGVAGDLPRLAVARFQQDAGVLPRAAFIGPGISGPAYEVDAAVLTARRWPESALCPGRAGHAYLDLAEAIACDLRSVGVDAVQRSGVCTAAHPDLHSFRHQGPRLVQALVVWREYSSFR